MLREKLDIGHPLRDYGRETDKRRLRSSLDEIFDFDEGPLERKDVEVKKPPTGDAGANVDTTGYLGDEKFDQFVDSAKESDALHYQPRAKMWSADPEEIPVESPLAVFMSRSKQARETDLRKQAKVTNDPKKYAENPDKYDYPYLDTTQEWEKKNNPFSVF